MDFHFMLYVSPKWFCSSRLFVILHCTEKVEICYCVHIRVTVSFGYPAIHVIGNTTVLFVLSCHVSLCHC
jgi:hypothetical protein